MVLAVCSVLGNTITNIVLYKVVVETDYEDAEKDDLRWMLQVKPSKRIWSLLCSRYFKDLGQ